MNNDDNLQNSSNIRSSLNDILALISEYPKLALPVGVVVALFGLATVFKTLIDGFKWAHDGWGMLGVLLVVGVIVATSLAAIWMVSVAVTPRPVIKPFPAYCLSRSPIIKWDYRHGMVQRTSYELRVKLLANGKETRIGVPERMHQIAMPDTTGEVEISVDALVAGKRIRGSRKVRTEIYRDSIQRIRETGKLRVAVHADPGEEIFCFYRDGQWQGFDIDLTTLIASELQQDPAIACPLKVEYSFFEWPAIIGAPNEHEVDVAIASISVSAERVKKYGINFSIPYAESKLGVVAYRRAFAGDESGDSVKLDALNGKTVAVHKETTASAFAERTVQDARYARISTVIAEDNDELRELLRDNNVDAVVHDYQRAFTLLEPGTAVYALDHDMDVPTDRYGIAFSRVNARLLDKVDAILKTHPLRLESMLAGCIENRRRAILAEDPEAGLENSSRSPSAAKKNLFVYGSLMYDDVWRRLVDGAFERVSAHLSGYRRLRIKDEAYPGLVKGVGVVPGIVWLGVDNQTLQRIDRFEAACYRRVSGVVRDEAGIEVPADFFEIKDSHRVLVEDAQWDVQEFERTGLSRFIDSYAGFKG